MEDDLGRPVLVGSIALDILRNRRAQGVDDIMLRWGGVVSNMACALGALGARPIFLSADYKGEMRWAVASHLSGNRVTWLPVGLSATIPAFLAEITERGAPRGEEFLGAAALENLTPEVLRLWVQHMGAASVVVTCTDLTPRTLEWLRARCLESETPFWLLCSARSEAWKMGLGGQPADAVSLNMTELEAHAGRRLTTIDDVIYASRSIVAVGGRAIVTVGAGGALLVDPHSGSVVLQRAPRLSEQLVTVAAGDVQFGCLLHGLIGGLPWEKALRHAVEATASFLTATVQFSDSPYSALLTPVPTTDGLQEMRSNDALSLFEAPTVESGS